MEDFSHKIWETAEAAYDPPCARMMFLAPINQHTKRSRNRLSLRMGILLRWSRSRTKIRGGQKKLVRLWIDIHRFGAKLGLDRFDFRELVVDLRPGSKWGQLRTRIRLAFFLPFFRIQARWHHKELHSLGL
jgi:hypothetical protein